MFGSTVYGACRKMPILWDAKTIDDRPMLMGTKLGIFTVSTFYSPMFTPFWICMDLDRIDSYMRNIPYADAPPSTWFDYIMS